MAKKAKNNEPTLNITELADGIVRITSTNGVRNKMTGGVYSEVVTKAKEVRKFDAV